MSDQNPSVTATAAAIEDATDGRWIVWLSETGWWWASRTRSLTAHELSSGSIHYIQADEPCELSDRIRHQDALCRKASERTTREPDQP